jgi:hypothetical protein
MIRKPPMLESESWFQLNTMRWFLGYKYVTPIPKEGICFKNSVTTLLGSIRTWGSPSRTRLETYMSIDPLSYLVVPIGLDEVDHEPNSDKGNFSTGDYPIILGGLCWDLSIEAKWINMVRQQDLWRQMRLHLTR